MLRIAICDNDISFCKKVEKFLYEYFNNIDIECNIVLFVSDEELVSLGMGVALYNIIYFSISKNTNNGIKTAKKIRECCKDIFIIFLAEDIDYILDGYKVDAMRYILKDRQDFRENIHESIDAIISKMNLEKKSIEFSFQEGRMDLYPEQIVYIESKLHMLFFNVIIHSEQKKFCIKAKLADIEEKISNKDFVRIHQSYLVNMRYVNSVLNYKAKICNGR